MINRTESQLFARDQRNQNNRQQPGVRRKGLKRERTRSSNPRR